VIAVDTNILVYAHRKDAEWHDRARARVSDLAQSPSPWAIPWPCLHEFLAIVTHPKIFLPATPREVALDQIDAWQESPSLVLLTESAGYWSVLRSLVTKSKVVGPQVHDARIAALCIHHGARELWTADRDFSRYASLRTTNPLV